MSSLRTLSRELPAELARAAAMHGFRFLWERVTHHRRKDAIFGFDHEADVNSARLLASWFRSSPPERQAARLGIGLHYSYGAMLGSLYAATCNRSYRFGKAQGVPLGVLLWVCADEIPIAFFLYFESASKEWGFSCGRADSTFGVRHHGGKYYPVVRSRSETFG